VYPALLAGSSGSDNAPGADNQQGRPATIEREPSETARQTGLVRARKIQSELHGDMQSQAEMTWPPSGLARE
jgi:hypothetical protein